jgi:hypothetical protein
MLQVDETQKSVVLKTSQMQEKLQSATAKTEDTAAKHASDVAARLQQLTANVLLLYCCFTAALLLLCYLTANVRLA